MTYLKTLFLSLFLLFICSAYSQSIIIPNIKNMLDVSSGYISQHQEISGYYIFAKSPKKSEGYDLYVLDENLKILFKKELTKPKKTYIAEAAYNGKAFLFRFVCLGKKNVELETYDRDGNVLGNFSYESEEKIYQKISLTGISPTKNSHPHIVPVSDKGFFTFKGIEKKKMTSAFDGLEYKFSNYLHYFSNSLEIVESKKVEESENMETIYLPILNSNHSSSVQMLSYQENPTDKRQRRCNLRHIDLNEPRLVFDINISSSSYSLYPFLSTYLSEQNKILTFGNYRFEKHKGQGSGGIFFQVHDTTGEEVASNYISWENDISTFVDVSKKGRIAEGGYLIFHEIRTLSDGRILIFGERFRVPTVSLNQPKAFLEEIFIFELNSKLELSRIRIFDKKKSTVFLPGKGAEFMYPNPAYLRYLGWHYFAFSQISENKETFYGTYTSPDGALNKKTWAIVGYIMGNVKNEIQEGYIELNRKANYAWVKPAKTGFVSIWEFHNNKDNIIIRLEPLGK